MGDHPDFHVLFCPRRSPCASAFWFVGMGRIFLVLSSSLRISEIALPWGTMILELFWSDVATVCSCW